LSTNVNIVNIPFAKLGTVQSSSPRSYCKFKKRDRVAVQIKASAVKDSGRRFPSAPSWAKEIIQFVISRVLIKENIMRTEIKKAVELYNEACIAEERGEMNLAEVYYLKSVYAFEEAGGRHTLNAANALNALAALRQSCGDYEGALRSAKRAAQIMDKHESQFASHDADLIRNMAWELIRNLIGCEFSTSRLIPGAMQ